MSDIEEVRQKIVLGEYLLPTPQILALQERVTKWVWGGLTGAIMTGLPRCGKTSAIKWISSQITTRSGQPIPLFPAEAMQRTQMTDKKFWLGMLLSLRYPLPKRSTAIEDMSRIINMMAEASLQNDESRVILSIDEAQRLTKFEYDLLIDLHNHLYAFGIRLFVLQVGTAELAERRQLLNEPEFAHIKGRFFGDSGKFLSPQSKEDIRAVLSLYDDKSIWGGRWSATYACLRETGWAEIKLRSFAQEFYQMYRTYIIPMGFSQWPISYLTAAIHILLLDLLPNYDDDTDRLDLVETATKGTSIFDADPEGL